MGTLFCLLLYIHRDLYNIWGVNEKLLTQHISGPVTKYKLLYCMSATRAGLGLGLGVRGGYTLSFADLAKFWGHLHQRLTNIWKASTISDDQ